MGYEESRRLEFHIHLENGASSCWKGFRQNLRNDIRKFERSDCVISSDVTKISAESLAKIDAETTLRHTAHGKDSSASDSRFYQAIISELIESGKAQIFLAQIAGKSLAFAIVGILGRRSYLLYAGSTIEGLTLNASKALLWYAIQDACSRGVERFNLGGVGVNACDPGDNNHGLYRFKTAFGGVETVCVSAYKLLRPRVARSIEIYQKIGRGLAK